MSWKTLLLDAGYQPIEVIDWKKAMELLILGKAELVEAYEGIPIRSASNSWKLPSILRLLKSFKRRKHKVLTFSRYNVFFRDNWTCQYCGKQKKSEELNFDHVVPDAQGGLRTWDNIVTACIKCNSKKANRTPEQAGMRLLNKPFRPHATPELYLRIKGNEPESWLSYIYWHGELT